MHVFHKAHKPPGTDTKQVMHVFHKKCLQKWLIRNLTCPLCKIKIDPKVDPKPLIDPKIDPKPSLDYWKLGNTTLAARMGENPFIVGLLRDGE